jgi:hypothetical protein
LTPRPGPNYLTTIVTNASRGWGLVAAEDNGIYEDGA